MSADRLTLDLLMGMLFLAYLLPTAEKGTWEFRKKNQRVTLEKDLPRSGHSERPAETQKRHTVDLRGPRI